MILPEVSLELDLMLTKEVGVMSSMLEGAGYMVVTATESGRELMTGKSSLKPTLNLASVKADEYRGLILPCLATTSGTKIPPAAIQIAKAVAASGKPVAAQKGGVLTLGEAGVLTSRRYSLSASSRLQLAGAAVAESIWQEGVPVVQDGNITTAWSCPYTERAAGVLDTTVELTQKFIEALKAAS
jgi:putative intracellular protease/amidase